MVDAAGCSRSPGRLSRSKSYLDVINPPDIYTDLKKLHEENCKNFLCLCKRHVVSVICVNGTRKLYCFNSRSIEEKLKQALDEGYYYTILRVFNGALNNLVKRYILGFGITDKQTINKIINDRNNNTNGVGVRYVGRKKNSVKKKSKAAAVGGGVGASVGFSGLATGGAVGGGGSGGGGGVGSSGVASGSVVSRAGAKSVQYGGASSACSVGVIGGRAVRIRPENLPKEKILKFNGGAKSNMKLLKEGCYCHFHPLITADVCNADFLRRVVSRDNETGIDENDDLDALTPGWMVFML